MIVVIIGEAGLLKKSFIVKLGVQTMSRSTPEDYKV